MKINYNSTKRDDNVFSLCEKQNTFVCRFSSLVRFTFNEICNSFRPIIPVKMIKTGKRYSYKDFKLVILNK